MIGTVEPNPPQIMDESIRVVWACPTRALHARRPPLVTVCVMIGDRLCEACESCDTIYIRNGPCGP